MNRFTGQERNGLNAFWIDSLCFLLLLLFSLRWLNEWEKGGGDATMEISGRKVFFLVKWSENSASPRLRLWLCDCHGKKKNSVQNQTAWTGVCFSGLHQLSLAFSRLRKGLKTHVITVIKEIIVWNVFNSSMYSHNWIKRKYVLMWF